MSGFGTARNASSPYALVGISLPRAAGGPWSGLHSDALVEIALLLPALLALISVALVKIG